MTGFIGVGVAVLVLVLTFGSLLGRSAWWLPRRLDRLLPDPDVEGARLGSAPTAIRTGDPSTAVLHA